MSKYTTQMEAELASATPITFEMATAFAEQWADKDVSVKSIVAKCKSLGIDYIPKTKAVRKTSGITKAQLVKRIEAQLAMESDSLSGLHNATMASLNTLLEVIA